MIINILRNYKNLSFKPAILAGLDKKIILLLIIFLFLPQGCNNIIDIGGVLINRINYTSIESELYISILNSQNKNIPNFNVNIIRENDSLSVTSNKISISQNPLKVSLPDEQHNPISNETHNLIVIAEHPYIGTFQQLIPVAKLNSNEPVIVEFYIGDIPDTLSVAPHYLYKQYNNF